VAEFLADEANATFAEVLSFTVEGEGYAAPMAPAQF